MWNNILLSDLKAAKHSSSEGEMREIRTLTLSQTNLRHSRPASDRPLPSSGCTGCASVHDAPDCVAARWPPPHHACRSYSHSCREEGGDTDRIYRGMKNMSFPEQDLVIRVSYSCVSYYTTADCKYSRSVFSSPQTAMLNTVMLKDSAVSNTSTAKQNLKTPWITNCASSVRSHPEGRTKNTELKQHWGVSPSGHQVIHLWSVLCKDNILFHVIFQQLFQQKHMAVKMLI